jgi:hypothetical protein
VRLGVGTHLTTAVLAAAVLGACVGNIGTESGMRAPAPGAPTPPTPGLPSDGGPAPRAAGTVADDASEPIEPTAPELDPVGPQVLVLGAPPGTAFSFTVPSGTYGLQLTGDNLWIDTLTDPTGRALYRGGVPVGWPAALYAPSSAQALMNEETVALGIRAGEWVVTLQYPTGPGAPISLVTQGTRDGAFHGGVLDVYLYVARSGVTDPDRGVTITPDNVLSEYGAGLDELFAELQRLAGLDRGDVRVVPIDDRLASIATDADETAAFGASDPSLGPGYHVVLVRGGYERGWSGIAPGAPAVQIPGDARSTVLMDVRTRDYFGWTLFHELGHVTGLYHLTDLYDDGGTTHFLQDPLDDTAECTTTRRITGDDGLDYTIPACESESNIMASFGTARPPTMSPTQRAIFRSAAVYRPYAADVPTTRSLSLGATMREPPRALRARLSRCAAIPVTPSR